jgi:hypothetical protein
MGSTPGIFAVLKFPRFHLTVPRPARKMPEPKVCHQVSVRVTILSSKQQLPFMLTTADTENDSRVEPSFISLPHDGASHTLREHAPAPNR